MATSSSKFKVIGILALTLILTMGAVFVGLHMMHAARIARSPDISGAWEGTIKVKTISLRVILNVSKSNGVYSGTVDSVDQGVRGVPVDNLNYDYPSVGFEMSGGTYKGKINSGATELSGTWKQGGVTTLVTLKRTTEPDTSVQPLAESDYAPRAGSDVQGVWKGTLKAGQMLLRLDFKIAEGADGSLRAEMDSVDQGAKGLPATGASYDRPKLKLEFAGINCTYTGDVQGGKIDGKWKQGGQSFPLALERGEAAAEAPALTADSYSYASKTDLQGHWKGTLNVKAMKLRLVMNIAKLPDGNFSANLVSLDQGASEIPASGVTYSAPKLSVDWSGIGANFTGEMKSGKLSGTWKQGGGSLPLVFTRD